MEEKKINVEIWNPVESKTSNCDFCKYFHKQKIASHTFTDDHNKVQYLCINCLKEKQKVYNRSSFKKIIIL